MITKVQSKTLSARIGVSREEKLSMLEKAMLKWVVVDPDDRLLDANVGAGMVAEYLRRNMQCEVCGVSECMEDVRYARSRLRSSDIVYAAGGEIPWRDNSFDTVLLKLDGGDPQHVVSRLEEVKRVLRPGGQLVLGVPCWPEIIADLLTKSAQERLEENHSYSKKELTSMLEALSFAQLSWQRTGPGTGVMTAWKYKPDARKELE